MMRCRSCSIYDTLRSKERRGFKVTIWVGKPQRGRAFFYGGKMTPLDTILLVQKH